MSTTKFENLKVGIRLFLLRREIKEYLLVEISIGREVSGLE